MSSDSIPHIVLSALEHKLPPKTDYGIAFIGCGGIVNYGYIPSYQASGFNMIGGYDINHEAAEMKVQTHGLKKTYSSLDELLTNPMVEIVNVAVVPEEQRNVVTKVIAAKKPFLSVQMASGEIKTINTIEDILWSGVQEAMTGRQTSKEALLLMEKKVREALT